MVAPVVTETSSMSPDVLERVRFFNATLDRLMRHIDGDENRTPVPVIALTAKSMTHHVAHYLAQGFDGHIAKPIDLRILLDTLRPVRRAKPTSGRPAA